MRIAPIAVVLLALAGCTTTTAKAPPLAGNCDAARAQTFIGQNGTAAADQARIAAGAGAVRVIAPDQAVTMDFRPDRLNVETDAAGKITRLRCG